MCKRISLIEEPTSDLMVDVLEVVPLHVDHHPPLNILKVIRQAGNEVPGKQTYLVQFDLHVNRISTW